MYYHLRRGENLQSVNLLGLKKNDSKILSKAADIISMNERN